MRISLKSVLALLALSISSAAADGPQDNVVDKVRPVPPPGIEVPESDRLALATSLAELQQRIEALRVDKSVQKKELLPDIEIFERAVNQAWTFGEFFSADEIKAGHELLQAGLERADQLAGGQAPWTKQTGLVVRGYISRLDQTVQPYGLVIPATYNGADTRLDIWLHGRGEKLSEVAFLSQRRKQIGQIAPANTIVLHPYGRFCNAFKFAGEIDILEAMDSVKRHYRIDENRVAIRGFSMGGAGCWQMAVHYPDLWFAANPGAGFAETPEFLRIFQQELVAPTAWEKTLWRWYDCPGYAANLYNCPTVAYSGELDQQKQAADLMERALTQEQLSLTHIIGPQTKHAIHPASGIEIERRLATLAERGRERVPRKLQLATHTLRYNRMHWLTLNGLEKHWEQARVEAEIVNERTIRVQTKNVTGFSILFPAGWCPFDLREPIEVEVNGQKLAGSKPQTDRSLSFHWWKGTVQPSNEPPEPGLHKRPQLQGPIDDAFMDTFVIVRPTGKSSNSDFDRWSHAELDHLVREWRRQFRGDAVVKDDVAVTPADIASAHLILFGDFRSNAVLSRMEKQLPVQWTDQMLALGGRNMESANHAPVLIYPNPLSSNRYVVLNSGFTFREYDYLNNARQVPRLPDWAVIDIRKPPNAKYPGEVVAAGFFNERWQ